MKKIKVIIGKDRSGKTSIARAMVCSVKDEEKTFLPALDITSPWAFRNCNENTKVIIIDDLRRESDLLSLIIGSVEGIIVEKPQKKRFLIHPEIIIICEGKIRRKDLASTGASILRRIEIIETIN